MQRARTVDHKRRCIFGAWDDCTFSCLVLIREFQSEKRFHLPQLRQSDESSGVGAATAQPRAVRQRRAAVSAGLCFHPAMGTGGFSRCLQRVQNFASPNLTGRTFQFDGHCGIANQALINTLSGCSMSLLTSRCALSRYCSTVLSLHTAILW